MISGNSIECRFPFLDTDLIYTVTDQVPFRYLTDFDMPRGEGDKILLREVAVSCGLKTSSSFAKKAMQFGSGIAKLSNSTKFESNRKAKAAAKYEMQ